MNTRLLATLLFVPLSGFAQNAQHPGGILDTGGSLVVHLMPTTHPSSIIDLIQKSQLIIDGTVSSLQPSINTRQDQSAPNLETNGIVGVNAVLAGTVPNNSAYILLQQTGGQFGNWTETVPEDPLVAPGERYLRFLVPDLRQSVPNAFGIPRYAAVGIWTGKVKIANGLVSFAEAASSSLKSYNQVDVNVFCKPLRPSNVSRIRIRIKRYQSTSRRSLK